MLPTPPHVSRATTAGVLAPQAAISAPHTAVPAALDAISALQATIVFPIWRACPRASLAHG